MTEKATLGALGSHAGLGPCAEVPVHPRNGRLWANVRPVGAETSVPSYPLDALYDQAGLDAAVAAERMRWIAAPEKHTMTATAVDALGPLSEPADSWLGMRTNAWTDYYTRAQLLVELRAARESAWREGFEAGQHFGVADDRYDGQRDPEHERPMRPTNPYRA